MSYPAPSYPDDLVELLPSVAVRGPARVYIVELGRAVGDLDLLWYDLYGACLDIGAAIGWMLDYRGALVGETRGGLTDDEYRGIIAAREIAFAGGITAPRVWSAWVGLIGSPDGTIETRYPAQGYLTGQLLFVPSSAWIERARLVMGDVVALGVQVTAAARPPGGARWNDPTLGWGVGTWGVRIL